MDYKYMHTLFSFFNLRERGFLQRPYSIPLRMYKCINMLRCGRVPTIV